MKATDVIKRDHEAAKDLFEKYKKAAYEDRPPIAEKIFEALEAHEKMEDDYFYPALADFLKDNEVFKELEREQDALADEVDEIRAMDPSPGRDERIKAVMDIVLAHAKKEEREILTRAEEYLDEETLEELGEQMEPESAVAKSE